MTDEVKNVKDLYNRLLPALKCKKNDMARIGIIGLSEKDIWTYFCAYQWKGRKPLSLCDMVSDILNTNSLDIYSKLRGVSDEN